MIASLQCFHSAAMLLWSISLFIFKDFRDQLAFDLWRVTDAIFENINNTSDLTIDSLPHLSEITFQYILICLAIGGIVTSLFRIFLAYGLLNLKKWAWVLTLSFEIFNLLGYVEKVLDGLSLESNASAHSILLIQRIIHLIISIIIIYLLATKKTRRYFL